MLTECDDQMLHIVEPPLRLSLPRSGGLRGRRLETLLLLLLPRLRVLALSLLGHFDSDIVIVLIVHVELLEALRVRNVVRHVGVDVVPGAALRALPLGDHQILQRAAALLVGAQEVGALPGNIALDRLHPRRRGRLGRRVHRRELSLLGCLAALPLPLDDHQLPRRRIELGHLLDVCGGGSLGARVLGAPSLLHLRLGRLPRSSAVRRLAEGGLDERLRLVDRRCRAADEQDPKARLRVALVLGE